jgi:hypothetical protein
MSLQERAGSKQKLKIKNSFETSDKQELKIIHLSYIFFQLYKTIHRHILFIADAPATTDTPDVFLNKHLHRGSILLFSIAFFWHTPVQI